MAKGVSKKRWRRKPLGGSLFIRAIYTAGFGLTIAAILQLVVFVLLQIAEHLVRK